MRSWFAQEEKQLFLKKKRFSWLNEFQFYVMLDSVQPGLISIIDLVRMYVINVINHELNTPFKEGRPGKDWLRSFMERKKLRTKKQT